MNQLTQQLLARAQAILNSPTRDYSEIGSVHKAITGVDYDCRPCNERRIINTLETFVRQPERYALRIQEAQNEMEQPTTTNYRFSKNATSKLIVLVTAHGTIAVRPDNLTDEKAEMVLAHKAYAHNIERIPGTEPEADAADTDSEEDSTGSEEGTTTGALAPNGNIIEVQAPGAGEVKSGTAPELTLEEARTRFYEVTGTKAGTRNLKTLLAAIAAAEPKA
ncbi:hypothetical protein [Pontibacter sp. H249]|uniref:hypothetical protein n=1 Tax=Pontibacter sp. H249 TaxID=3133420 RepID=UPI0030BEC082